MTRSRPPPGLITMKHDGCTKVAVANDKEAYGSGLARLLELEKGKYGITITSNTGIDPTAPNFRAYASTAKAQGADCFYFAGIVSNGAVQITKDVAAAIPHVKIYGGDGICTGSYTNPSMHGIPASIDPQVQCTVATQNLTAYPGGRAFLAAYKAKYGTLESRPVRHLRLRGRPARDPDDRRPGPEGQRQVGGPGGAVRHQGPPRRDRHLRVRRQRGHDAAGPTACTRSARTATRRSSGRSLRSNESGRLRSGRADAPRPGPVSRIGFPAHGGSQVLRAPDAAAAARRAGVAAAPRGPVGIAHRARRAAGRVRGPRPHERLSRLRARARGHRTMT